MPSTVLKKQCGAMEDHGPDAMVIIAPETVAWTSGVLPLSPKIVQHCHAVHAQELWQMHES